MAQITGSPVFQDNVRQLVTTDLSHPTTWNPIHENLIDNDVYLKQAVTLTSTSIAAGVARNEALMWATRFI